MKRIVLIGRSPSRRIHAANALLGNFPERYAPKIPLSRYKSKCWRVNLIPRPTKKIRQSEAARRAALLRRNYRGCVAILFGRDVARAFGYPRSRHFIPRADRDFRYCYVVPHPSGLNRWWNDYQRARRARLFFSDLLRRA